MTKGFIIIKGWDAYNKIIDKNKVEEYKQYVKKQTGAKRIHTRFVEA